MGIRFWPASLLLAILLLCGLSTNVAAYSEFDPATPCEAVGRANAAFLGRALRGTPTNWGEVAGEERVTGEVTFEVIEPFFGITDTVITTYSHPDSIFETSYVIGEIYVIYGRQKDDRLLTGLWTGSKILKEAGMDLAYLRQQSQQPEGAHLYGQIIERPIIDDDKTANWKFLKEITVRVEDREGNYFDVVTDEQGRYEINNINPGRYKIYPLIPERFKQEDIKEVVVIGQYGCVEQTFSLMPKGRTVDGEDINLPSEIIK